MAEDNHHHKEGVLLWIVHNVTENPIYMGWIISFIIIILSILATRNLKENPGRLQNVFELFVEKLSSFIEEIMGKRGLPFLPLFGTLVLFILFSNLAGLIPGCGSPTGNWNTTIALALAIFFTTHFMGIKHKGIGYLSHFLFPIRFAKGRLYLLPFSIIIDLLFVFIHLIGELARPFSLSLRLFVNMFSKHITLLCLGFVIVLFAKTPILYVLTMFVPILLPPIIMGLGIITCIVQAFIFVLLSIIYIQLAVEEEEHT